MLQKCIIFQKIPATIEYPGISLFLGSHKGLNYIMRESLFSSQICENKDLLTSSKSTIYVTVTLGMDKGIRTTLLYLHSRKSILLRVNLNQLSHLTFTYCQVSQKRFQFPAKTTRKKLKNVSVGKLLDPSPLVYTIGISCNCSQKHPRGNKKKKKKREGGSTGSLVETRESLLAVCSPGRENGTAALARVTRRVRWLAARCDQTAGSTPLL